MGQADIGFKVFTSCLSFLQLTTTSEPPFDCFSPFVALVLTDSQQGLFQERTDWRSNSIYTVSSFERRDTWKSGTCKMPCPLSLTPRRLLNALSICARSGSRSRNPLPCVPQSAPQTSAGWLSTCERLLL
ncbi:hypothetical protein BDZ97DRAFT_863454 [Flammula alnicola]|nr:hypothetical protein BDZ97DRAFT_863454 [Flammula alnicola]